MARERRARSLVFRLAATYALLVAAALLVVAGLAIQLVRTHLEQALDERLSSVVASFRSGPALRIGDASRLEAEARTWLALRGVGRDEFVAVRTSEGEVLAAAGGLDLRRISGSAAALRARASDWMELEGPDGAVRVLVTPLVLDGARAGTLAVGASRGPVEGAIAALLSGIGWAGAAGLVLATLLGVAAVRRTLRPLATMSRRAGEIEETGDVSRRVGTQGPRDEVGVVAEAFDRMLARLEESFRSQRRFVADASHELRTPLTVIRGQLELLEEEIRTADGRRSLALATEELDRMGRIVEDLLLLAKLDEGAPLALRPIEVELVLREALLRGLGTERREVDVRAPGDLLVIADHDRLLQVLSNLIANAVSHAGEDARISLRAERRDGTARIEVADDGKGIGPDELPHVFERLYRGRGARTGATAGAGLGLAIAASLIEAMDGTIAVDSEPGVGTTFSISLPVATDPAATTEPRALRR